MNEDKRYGFPWGNLSPEETDEGDMRSCFKVMPENVAYLQPAWAWLAKPRPGNALAEGYINSAGSGARFSPVP